MDTKLEIAKNWLPRYTGMPLEQFGEYILITNFKDYVTKFSERFSSEIYGEGRAMQASTNNDGLTIINYGIGSPEAYSIFEIASFFKAPILMIPERPGNRMDAEINTTKTEGLGWKPKWSIEDYLISK